MQTQQPQQPASGVTIVNGAPTAPAAATTASQGDHSRKPSVTITSAGTSGYMPNGGSASRPQSLQFGFANPQSSPNMGNPAVLANNQSQSGLGAPSANPRVTSPQTSPSPIPQPASSGGRPPSTYQGQGNVPNFGSFGESGDNNMRPSLQAPLGPGPQHLRRESSQSTHSDMSNHMGSGPGRGGYPHQGGRGRGYSQSGYQGQMPYSPGPNFRQTPNQPRGGPNMGPQFHGGPNQARPLAPFPNSPHQANRSPALANAHPTTPQMNPVPMAGQMPPQPYGAYGQHMGPQTVRSHNSSRSNTHKPARRGSNQKRGHPRVFSANFTPPDLRPEAGNWEHILTLVKSHQAPYPPYDPNYGYYNPGYGMQQQYMPPSPQPRPGMPFNPQAGFMPGQYPVQPPQAAPLSRTPSQVSTDRPGSSLGQPAQAGPGHAHTASRSSNSPAPAKSHFVLPSKKSAIVIKDPGSGAVKTFDKNPASPARATPSPVKIATPTSTPPPRTASASDHSRTESKASTAKTDEEKKQELKDAVRQKIQEDEAAQKRAAEEAARKDTKEAEPAKPKEESADPSAALEKLTLNDKSAPAEEPKKADAPAPAPAPAAPAAPADDDEIDFDAIEREMAEIEAKERAAEEDYNRKKQEKKEAAERKEREDLENYEKNMKQAEREAEERELAKEAARAKGETVTTDDDSSRKEREDLFASLKKGGFAATEASTPGDSGAATPVSSDMSMGPPGKPASATAKKPAALKLDTPKATEPAQPSAAMKSLQNAQFLKDLSKITYPESVTAPNLALNANSPVGRQFHYDRDFLLQFQAAYKDKPSIDWDNTVRETLGDPSDSSRPQSARPGPGGLGPRGSSRGGAMGVFTNPGMGQFNAPGSRNSMPPVNTPMGGRNGPFAFPRTGGIGAPGMSRNNSSGMPSPRVASSKGGRNASKKHPGKKEEEQNKSMPLTAGMDLKAIQTTATGWKPRSVGQAPSGPTPAGSEGHMAPDVVQRKVKAALNKMTPEKFDRIAEQILVIVSQSKDESDGRTLRQVIQLTFEKATDEAHWAPMYAKFCKAMLESMSLEIKDENIRDKNGNVVAGGNLFRKYLLNRCQEEFERGWKVNLPEKPEGTSEEVAMLSDEYYIAAAAKRRGLGLVKFIGELYKLGMLTERIMHECVKKLVDYDGIPDEAEVESLTSLLRTIGSSLDASEKGHAMMDAYFARITMMMETVGLPSRLRFMLLDIIDLRSKRWQSKDSDKGPKTIQQIREEAARAAQEQEMERQRQQSNRGGGGGGRMAMGRGDVRYGQQAPPPDYASSKVGSDDLRRLRATRNPNQPMSFGPSSLLGSRSNSGRKNLGPGGNLVRASDDSAASSRSASQAGKKEDASSSMNAFSALAALEDKDNMATSPPSNPTSPMLTKTQPATAERRPSKTPSKDGENAA
ncbi:unnamed protein product [Penicillium manginii]